MDRPLAERLSRRVELSVEGRRWPVLFSHGALLDILELTGLDAFNGEIRIANPSGRLLRAALYAVLRRCGACESLEAAGQLVRFESMAKIRSALVDGWDASMPEPEPPKSSGGKPKKLLGWMEAWAIAHEDLRLADSEWLAMTPRMVQALSNQRLEHVRWAELLAGTISAYGANFGMCRPDPPIKPRDLMLHPWSPEEIEENDPESTGVSGERIMQIFARAKVPMRVANPLPM